MSTILSENREVLEKLNDLALQEVTAANLKAPEIHKALNDLFGQALTPQFVDMLIKPWVKTLQLVGITKHVKAHDEQEKWLNCILSSINKLRLDLQMWQRNGLMLSLFTLFNGKELDLTILFGNLEELEHVVTWCTNLKEFGRGGKFSHGKIKRYGVFSLFFLGQAAGLKHEGKPSPLFTIIKTIAQLDAQEVADYYQEYKKTTLDKELDQNPMFAYIFNPALLNSELRQKMSRYYCSLNYDF